MRDMWRVGSFDLQHWTRIKAMNLVGNPAAAG